MAKYKKNSRHKSSQPVVAAAPKVHYPYLDGLRGIAILMILSHHIRHAFALDYLFSHPSPFLKGLYFTAWDTFGVNLAGFYIWLQDTIHQFKGILGLQMFFVLSGFLISRMLLKGGLVTVDIARFYKRRFLKIYPSYAFLVILSLFLFYHLTYPDMDEILATGFNYLTFLQNYFPRNQLLEHTWSLVVMEQFYFLCPLVLWAVIRYVRTEQERRALLIGLCSLILVLAPVIRLYCLATGDALITWPAHAPRFWRTTLFHFDSLAFGCLLGLLEPQLARLKDIKWAGWLFWAPGAALYYYLFFVADWSYYWGPWYMYTLGYLSSGLLIIAALCGVAVLSRFPLLRWIGIYSYGIYLWHYLVISLCGHWAGRFPIMTLILICLTSSIAVGVLSTKLIESYFLSLRAKWFPDNVKATYSKPIRLPKSS
jgi:peptidoglycan/LPS O-acetylase OafA/YrhL